eukprot:2031658-Pleurochrysis_carterae.AAC.1
MILSRSAKNKRGARGLVKKSAKLSALHTKGTVMSCVSTRSRTKKCEIAAIPPVVTAQSDR